MNPLPCLSRVLLPALLLILSATAPVPAAELPGDSIYRLPVRLVDQDGRGFRLADRRGKLQLVSMFYTSCQYICPLIIDTLRKTRHALAPAERARLQVLLVSFDPGRDTPARLNEVFKQRRLDAASWTLARTGESDVRKIAAALDIQYRALANGEINHSGALVLLDANGSIVARTGKIGETDPDFIVALRSALASR